MRWLDPAFFLLNRAVKEKKESVVKPTQSIVSPILFGLRWLDAASFLLKRVAKEKKESVVKPTQSIVSGSTGLHCLSIARVQLGQDAFQNLWFRGFDEVMVKPCFG